MKKYKIDKKEKHDYAGGRKLYRKLHALFYKLCGSREKAYPFYRSYRHRNHAPGAKENTSHYMTEIPAYHAGFGHGLGAWRAGLVNAKAFGLSYAYSPMVTPGWDEVMGLGEGLPKAKDLLRQGYRKVVLPYYDMDSEASKALIRQIIRSYEGQKVVFYNEYEQWTGLGGNIEGDGYIREMFWASSARQRESLLYEKDWFNVALHIRRGDVRSRLSQGDTSMQKRWLELDYYTRLMEQILALKRSDVKLCFYVFSEGEEKDFEALKSVSGAKVVFCLKMSAEESFLHLCRSDLLVTAPSSFSIIAGAIHKGLKLVPDRDWLTIPDNAEWIRIPEDGKIAEQDRETIGSDMKTLTR